MIFAKIFEVKQFQLLYTCTRNENSKEHKDRITLRVDDEDTMYEVHMGYKDLNRRTRAFEEIDIHKAKQDLDSMRKALNF